MLGVGAEHGDPGEPAAAGTGTARSAREDPYAAERDAWTVALAAHGLGPVGFATLLARFGTAREVMAVAAGPEGVERLTAADRLEHDPDRRRIGRDVALAVVEAVQTADVVLQRLRALGVRIVTMEERAYPARLAAIAMPPPILFVTGDPEALGRSRAVAVVGTRRATSLGRTLAGRIADALVAAGSSVISGLAFGIDGSAHEATVRAGGITVAVIGGGHASLGPRAHDRLASAILRHGGAIVSELGPDVQPTSGTFPRRNRIISGLADATVVVEAPARSGALITASWALEQGRGCYLVPGPIDAPSAAGCLGFLREWPGAARVVAGVPQLIADLGYSEPSTVGGDRLVGATTQGLGVTEAAVATALVAGHATVDEIVAVTDLPIAATLATLTLLERRGLATGIHGRYRPAGTLLGSSPPTRRPGVRQRPTVAGSPDAMLP